MADTLLLSFIGARALITLAEHGLALLNWNYARDPERQAHAARLLGISSEDMERSQRYTYDRYRFSGVRSWSTTAIVLLFIAAGGLGLFERWAQTIARHVAEGPVTTGLLFFAQLGLASLVLSLPFSIYDTFVIEQRHGFNRQTPRGFVTDVLKGLLVALVLGGAVLALVLWLMQRSGGTWWLWAWGAVSGFSLLTAWIYPRVLAPLFNRFTPLPEGELRERILALASATGFRAGGLWVMDASRRSTHGNAYFTGLFGEKRIVLFDTLLSAVEPRGVVAVLAHELGHFRLGHVWRQVVRGTAFTGLLFLLLGQVWHYSSFYWAFGMAGPSSYGALVVFGLWFGLADFFLQPLLNGISRRHERAADAFAAQHAPARDLADALLKLREESHLLPLSHPLFSLVYHSHPPLLSRLEGLGVVGGTHPGA